jgi:hypothetical protein
MRRLLPRHFRTPLDNPGARRSGPPARRAAHKRMPALLAVCLLTLCLLPACGGGGGSLAAAPPAPTNLGLLASTQGTRVPLEVQNPLAVPATVTAGAPMGGTGSGTFTIDSGSLPASVPAGGTHTIQILFSPTGEGVASGAIRLRYEGAGQMQETAHELVATAEAVTWSVAGAPIDFGTIAAISTSDRTVTIRNASSVSPVSLGATVQTSNAAWAVVDTAFPLAVPPGEQAEITVRFSPPASGNYDGYLDVGVGSAGGPVRLLVLGSGAAALTSTETIVDFGLQAFSGITTAQLQVDVPADAISLTVEGYDPTDGCTLGLGELLGPGGRVYENTALTGAYIWGEGAEVFATTIPNTDRTNVQMVPGGGTYAFRIRRMSGSSPQVAVRAIIERRAAGTESQGTLDLNVWLANGLSVTAASAASDSRLQNILARIDTILRGQGIGLGEIDYYDVANPSYDDVSSEFEFSQMLRTTSSATHVRLNLFFVETTLTGGVVGVAATISGPARNGTSLSGVMSIYDSGFTENLIGLIAAHEIGHLAGLYHTVEQNGAHDFVDDTAECRASGSDSVCPTAGGGYLMHWQALGGSTISNGQGLVLRAHPLVRAAAGGAAKFRPAPLEPIDFLQAEALPEGWCGCPGCGHGPAFDKR